MVSISKFITKWWQTFKNFGGNYLKKKKFRAQKDLYSDCTTRYKENIHVKSNMRGYKWKKRQFSCANNMKALSFMVCFEARRITLWYWRGRGFDKEVEEDTHDNFFFFSLIRRQLQALNPLILCKREKGPLIIYDCVLLELYWFANLSINPIPLIWWCRNSWLWLESKTTQNRGKKTDYAC